MTQKKKLSLSIGISIVLLSIIAVLTIHIIQLAGLQRVTLSGIAYAYPFDELIADSHLVARGKFVGDSGAFEVDSTSTSDNTVFTDYYFEITDVLRGDEQSGNTVSIRIQGGKVGNLLVENRYDTAPPIGSEAIVFVRKVTAPDQWTTNEDVYYLTGTTPYSFFFLDEQADTPTYKCGAYDREPIVWETDRENIIALSKKLPFDTSTLKEYKLMELEEKKQKNEMTISQYNDEIEKLNTYATRLDNTDALKSE